VTGKPPEVKPEKGRFGVNLPVSREDSEPNELYVHVRIGYKTILLVFIVFDFGETVLKSVLGI